MTTGYGIDGVDLDAEANQNGPNLFAFAQKMKELDPTFIVTQPVFGSPQVNCENYPVVIINWVQYLGLPGPFSFPDSRDLLEVLGDCLGRERDPYREDPLGSGRIP